MYILQNDIKKDLKDLKLLFVKDEQLSQEIMKTMLKEFFDTIFVASDGEEGLQIYNDNAVDIIIDQVKKYGVKIAIDDFGSGYSNFERLLEYQPDILKIDGSLVKNIVDDAYSLSIVKTIVSFAKEQNLQIVAEYVENEKIYNILNSLGIDFSQGYYFAQPKPLEEV